MLIDYHHKPSSPKYIDDRNFWPRIMYQMHTELPLISYLQKANSSFFWSGNYSAGCNDSRFLSPSLTFKLKWVSCINSANDLSSSNIFKFYLTTPFATIYKRIVKHIESQDSIGKFLKYIDKNGVPKTPFFAFIHHLSPHRPFLVTDECEPTNYFNQDFEGYKASYQCALKKVKIFMQKINNIDPEAIVVFQADHGLRTDNYDYDLELTEKEKYLFQGKIFNAIKAPETCFDKYGLPKTNVNTIRFTLNCAYGFKLPYRKNIHYKTSNWGTVVEKIIYE